MIDPLVKKLSHYMDLTEEEKQILENAATQSIYIEKGDDIITQGQRPDYVHLIETGWACRYKLLDNGDNHILAFLIPGDLCDVHVTILDQMDHSIRALTPVKLTKIPANEIRAIQKNHFRLAQALFWSTLVDEAILREWLVSMGKRSAEARLAHIFCEMLLRSRIAGLTLDDSFDFPLTQTELGDSMGLTVVHTNRIIQRLRQEGLIALEKRRLAILDWERMTTLAHFDPIYLHYQNVS